MNSLTVMEWGDPKIARWMNRSPAYDPAVGSSVADTIESVRLLAAEAVLSRR